MLFSHKFRVGEKTFRFLTTRKKDRGHVARLKNELVLSPLPTPGDVATLRRFLERLPEFVCLIASRTDPGVTARDMLCADVDTLAGIVSKQIALLGWAAKR